ncbi:MAG: heparinase II/III-family protein [Candidatus Latescibacteria bacterium]|nr:heparinase II/III-family protein [Candidatus Latescibacterota bacterium]
MNLMAKVADFILDGSFRMGDRMRVANIGDSREGWCTLPAATAYLARRLRHSGLQWFLHNSQNNLKEASLVPFFEQPVFTFLWYDPALKPEEPKHSVPAKLYPGAQWAVMRSGWGHEDSMLVFKSGATAGHAHPDAGSFVLYTRDELLLIDSGVCGYEMPEYQGYYHTTRAHNTILVGGEGQIKRLPGEIIDHAGVPGLGFTLGDATAPYEGRLKKFIRGVLFVGDEYYVVFDQLAKNTNEPFQWLLHYDGKMTPESEGLVIRKGGAAVLVNIVEPAARTIDIRQGLKSYHEELNLVKSTEEKQAELQVGDYLEITPARNASRRQYLTVLYPFDAKAPVPKVEAARSPAWIALRIARQGENDLIGLRQTGARRRVPLGGVDTDADFFCVTSGENGRPLRAMMQAGTSLKIGGTTLASSPRRATVAVEM